MTKYASSKRYVELCSTAYSMCRKISDGGSDNLVLTDAWSKEYAVLLANECADWINSNVGMVTDEARLDLLAHLGLDDGCTQHQ